MRVAIDKFIFRFALFVLSFAFFAPSCLKLPDKEITPVKNMPPVIDPVAQVIVNEGEEIVIEPQISDPDGDTMSFNFGGWAPGGYYKDLNIPAWRYITSYDDAGDYSVWVAAKDEKTKDGETNKWSTTVRKDILIKVNNVNRPPQCPLNPLQTVDELSTLAFNFRASDPDTEDNLRLAYTFKWQGQMPGGVTGFALSNLDNYNSVDFSYSPIFGARGSYVMEFSVTDQSVPSYTISCSIPLEVQDVLSWEKAGDLPDWAAQAVVTSLAFNSYESVLYAGLSGFFDPLFTPIPDQGYGVYAYSPLGNTWDPKNTGLADLRVLDLRIKPEGTLVYIFAATTTGIYRYEANNGISWQEASAGIPNNHRRIFTLELDSQGKLWAGPGLFTGPLYFSGDNSQTWSSTCDQNQCNPYPAYSTGITDLIRVYDLASGGNLFIASVFRESVSHFFNALLKSIDLGVTWEEIGNPFGHQNSSRVIAFDPENPQKIYVGLENRGIVRSIDGGITWLEPVLIGTVDSYPRVILPIAYTDYPDTVLVGMTQRGIWRSRDGGATFTAQNNGLPGSISIRSIAVDPNDLRRLYVGTEYNGVYRTKIP